MAVTAIDDECAICLELLLVGNGNRTLACGHCFHGTCIATALRRSVLCPICREPVSTTAVAVVDLTQLDEPFRAMAETVVDAIERARRANQENHDMLINELVEARRERARTTTGSAPIEQRRPVNTRRRTRAEPRQQGD